MHLISDICELNGIVKSKRMRNYANQTNGKFSLRTEYRKSKKKNEKKKIRKRKLLIDIFDTNNVQTTKKNWKIFASSAFMLFDNLFLFLLLLQRLAAIERSLLTTHTADICLVFTFSSFNNIKVIIS